MAQVITAIAHAHGLELSRVGAHVKVENTPWMPLSVEVIGPHLVSVCHYGEQNGDLMRDPEMVFFTDTTDGSWIPVSFQNDYVGAYRVGTVVEDGRITAFYPREQADQADFATTWARAIEEQRFAAAALATVGTR